MRGTRARVFLFTVFFFFFAISAIISFTIMRNKIMSIMNLKSK